MSGTTSLGVILFAAACGLAAAQTSTTQQRGKAAPKAPLVAAPADDHPTTRSAAARSSWAISPASTPPQPKTAARTTTVTDILTMPTSSTMPNDHTTGLTLAVEPANARGTPAKKSGTKGATKPGDASGAVQPIPLTPTPLVLVPITVAAQSQTAPTTSTRVRSIGNPAGIPKEAIDKSLVLEMALFLYDSDHHHYPMSLEQLRDGQNNYLTAAAKLRGVTLDTPRVQPPQGYRWFYDFTAKGDQYLLGLTLKDQLSASLDPKMPIVCSLEHDHVSLLMPGPEAAQIIQQYRALRIDDPSQ